MPEPSVPDISSQATSATQTIAAEVKHLTPEERQVFDAVGVANKALLEYRYGSDAPISSEQISREAEKVSGDISNRVRKQEPMVNKPILAAMILQGAEANGAPVENSEKIAVLLHDARRLNPAQLSDDKIRAQFGDGLGQKVIADLNGIDSAMKGDAAASARYGNDVAALEVAELRMAVRSAGDKSVLGEKAGPGFLDADSPKFDEAIRHAQEALKSPGVDPKMYNGTETLVDAAKEASKGIFPASTLTDGADSAVPKFQNGLASIAPYQQGEYNADETALNRTLRATFEVSRYQVHNRRKDGTPDVNHALEVAGYDKTTLDANALSARMLHDLNEDRYWDPYSAKPEQVYRRFGPVVAGTVAEATDIQPTPEQLKAIEEVRASQGEEAAKLAEKKLSRTLGEQSEQQYAQKARLFAETPLTRAEPTYSKLDGEHHQDVVNRAANPELPFSVDGALLKIADWRQSMQATLDHPERVTDPRSGSSGFMLGVQRKKEGFIEPLVETLASPQRRSELEALGVNTQELDAQLKAYADTSRKYTELALDTVAKERGLSTENTTKLKEIYFTAEKNNQSPEAFQHQLKAIGFVDKEVVGKDGKTRLVADNVISRTDPALVITADNLQKNRANSLRLAQTVNGPEAGIPRSAQEQVDALHRMYEKSENGNADVSAVQDRYRTPVEMPAAKPVDQALTKTALSESIGTGNQAISASHNADHHPDITGSGDVKDVAAINADPARGAVLVQKSVAPSISVAKAPSGTSGRVVDISAGKGLQPASPALPAAAALAMASSVAANKETFSTPEMAPVEPTNSASTSAPLEHAGGVGGRGALFNSSGIGIGLGVMGFINAHTQHDKWEEFVSGANVATGAAELTKGLKASKQLTPVLETGLDYGKKANIGLTVADGIVQVGREDTTGHRVQRAAAVTGVAAVGTVAGVVGGGAAVTVGAPLTTGYLANKDIELSRMRQKLNNELDAVKVDYTGHSNLEASEKELAQRLLKAGVTMDGQGHFDATNLANADKIINVFHAREQELEKSIQNNSTHVPTVTEALMKKRMQVGEDQVELKKLQVSEKELGDEYVKAHPEAAAAARTAVKLSDSIIYSNQLVTTIHMQSELPSQAQQPRSKV